MQFIERSHRSKIIDVESENLIAYLRQHRVVKLKKRQLHPSLYSRRRNLLADIVAPVGRFEQMEHLCGTLDYRLRHAGQTRNMNAEAVL